MTQVMKEYKYYKRCDDKQSILQFSKSDFLCFFFLNVWLKMFINTNMKCSI